MGTGIVALAIIWVCLTIGSASGRVYATRDEAASATSHRPVIAGGQWSQDHYSPLTQINRQNVKKLAVAWTYQTGEAGDGLQTNPLVVDRVIYATTASSKVIALDAVSGKLIWKFDSGVPGEQPIRGVAYWTDGKESRVLCGIMNYVYALDAATGKPIESFGEGGRIDLRKGLGGDYRTQSIVLTSPGVIYKDLIIVGGREPETPPAPRGDIRAFDVRTGKMCWIFHTIPHPGESGYETWPQDAWKTAGAANNWAGMTVDATRGIVYAPTGSAVPDFYGGRRAGDDLYADCLLALNAETGRLIWYFQDVHHDIWDRDIPAPPVLLQVRKKGKMVDAVAQTTKQGFVFVLDRDTGKPLFPIEERSVATSTVPGEVSSKTQPFPILPAPYARQSLAVDDLTTRTPEAHAWAVKQYQSMISGTGQFVPLAVGKETIVAPGFEGGGEWGGAAVDRTTGVLYVNSNNVVETGSLAVNDPAASLGLSTYQRHCALCHRDNRAGSPPEIPSLIGVSDHLTQQQILELIHTGKGRMPSFPNLDNSQTAAVLTYLRTPPGDQSDATKKELQRDSVVSKEDAGHAAAASDPAGAKVYAANCAICHGASLQGIPKVFPALTGIGTRQSAQQITTTVRSGKGRMPAFGADKISESDLETLLHFLGASELKPADSSSAEMTEMNRYRFTGYHKFRDPDGYPAVTPPWGTLNAIDLNTGEYLWTVSLGDYPALAAKGMGNTGTENYGGPIVTAGGIVVIGATVFDRKIRAFDSRTGVELWECELPFAGAATPTTYMVNGKQYIVIAAGGQRQSKGATNGTYVAFALP